MDEVGHPHWHPVDLADAQQGGGAGRQPEPGLDVLRRVEPVEAVVNVGLRDVQGEARRELQARQGLAGAQ